MADLRLERISKSFGKVPVLHDVSLQVAEGTFCILLGPSGCGKTTLLRIAAGLEQQDAGQVHIGGRPVGHLPPQQRDVAMVFQSYALYPHMSVRQNLAFPLRARRTPGPEVDAAVARAAGLLGIDELLERKPRELSGGQRQRVAIGRAIVRSPQLFLFDEPLSNLDAKLRAEMRRELTRLHRTLGTTSLYVTHDQVEAMTMGEHVVLLSDGQIQQQGSPDDLYRRPANLFVARFIGSPQMNLLEGELGADGDGSWFRSGGAQIPLGERRAAPGPATLGVRPEELRVSHAGQVGERDCTLCGTLEFIERLGPRSLVHASTEAGMLVAEVPAEWPGRVGDRVALGVQGESVHLFRGGLRLGRVGLDADG